MTRLSDISSLHWQPALGGDGVVENVDDIHQAIRVILRTPKGADPLRPQFGSKLHQYLDYPVDRARPHVVREVVEAISDPLYGEPRVTVQRVLFDHLTPGHVRLHVQSRLAGGVQIETEVAL